LPKTAGYVLQTSTAGIIINHTDVIQNWRYNKMDEITKDTIIGDILDIDRTTAPFFLEMGMHCLGCPSSRGETIEQACMVHGVNPDELIAKLNAHISGK
jgi:hybrid cluster-associated redox disulfide protein